MAIYLKDKKKITNSLPVGRFDVVLFLASTSFTQSGKSMLSLHFGFDSQVEVMGETIVDRFIFGEETEINERKFVTALNYLGIHEIRDFSSDEEIAIYLNAINDPLRCSLFLTHKYSIKTTRDSDWRDVTEQSYKSFAGTKAIQSKIEKYGKAINSPRLGINYFLSGISNKPKEISIEERVKIEKDKQNLDSDEEYRQKDLEYEQSDKVETIPDNEDLPF